MQFSDYVNDNAEILRNYFVSHEGKKELNVFANYNDPGFRNVMDKNFRWDYFTESFT